MGDAVGSGTLVRTEARVALWKTAAAMATASGANVRLATMGQYAIAPTAERNGRYTNGYVLSLATGEHGVQYVNMAYNMLTWRTIC